MLAMQRRRFDFCCAICATFIGIYPHNPGQNANHKHANPNKWVTMDIECDAGCGVVPFRYREQSYVNALQWAIGLEIFLLVRNPWQVVLTTDHPNGGPFTSYPHLIRLLMDRSFREEQLAKLHPEVEIGKAIPHTHQAGDIRFIHYGYTDEVTRRGRFLRNFPLLLRDLEKHPNRVLNKFLHLRDLAQGLAFEGQQTGGVSEGMVQNARKVVDLFRELIDVNPMVRMTLDAVPYYSTAVSVLGGGFHAKFSVETKKDELPGVAARATFEGRFDSIETYTRLLARIAKETTTQYEAQYL